MFVLIEGQLHVRGELGGQTAVFTFAPAQRTIGGRLPFFANEAIHVFRARCR